jgi:two-component system phosphate regulon response regulator PhoB
MPTLLIADDEASVRTLIRLALERDDYRILEASNGREALALAREERPDVVLLDVEMPDLSGYEVCRRLKEDPTTDDIAVLMLTAREQETAEPSGGATPPDDYVVKPFSPLSLDRKVTDLLANRPRPGLAAAPDW